MWLPVLLAKRIEAHDHRSKPNLPQSSKERVSCPHVCSKSAGDMNCKPVTQACGVCNTPSVCSTRQPQAFNYFNTEFCSWRTFSFVDTDFGNSLRCLLTPLKQASLRVQHCNRKDRTTHRLTCGDGGSASLWVLKPFSIKSKRES